ncbi:MAG: hypothetical protein B6I31_04710 [Desulfobacteraceae bacterium 4572_19]|nr:MAG: hypothetical protein B6I31_04710 [Desulfobacteraceae bacterium 4572_19]
MLYYKDFHFLLWRTIRRGGYMKKKHIGLLHQCLIILLVVIGTLFSIIHLNNYFATKKNFIQTKRMEVKFAIEIIDARVKKIKDELDSMAFDLSDAFKVLNPSDKKKTELIKSLWMSTDICGIGFVESPCKNAYTQYFYRNGMDFNYIDIKKKNPDYSTLSWFAYPARTKLPYIEISTVKKIKNRQDYTVTCSYPYIDVNDDFKGVFIFDLFLKRLVDDLEKSLSANYIDVSLFFLTTENPKKIKFIGSTKTITPVEQNRFLHLIQLIDKNKGIFHFDIVINKVEIVGSAISIFDDKVFVMATLDKMLITQGLRRILYRDFSFGIITLFSLFICFYFILKYALKSIETISQNVMQISNGNFDVDISVKSNVIEVIRLNDAIQKMQIQLKSYIEKIKETTKLETELETELKIAANIQKNIIPKPVSTINGHPYIDLFQMLKPAKEASGDFYDYFMLDDNNLFLSIGDVTGKGIPASLFTVMMISMEKMCKNIHFSMPETMGLINREIIPMNDTNMFVSYFCMVINLVTGKAKYANAGHESPFIIKNNGEVFQLKQGTGTFLGIFDNTKYSEEHYQFQEGDSILMFTDGVTEALNSNGELFGKKRILDVLSNVKPKDSATNIIYCIDDAIGKYVGKASQSDDICMFCLKYK